MQKRYSVCLFYDVDWESFWYDMENPTTGLPHIPDRVVEIAHNMDGMDRICYYMLTSEEANAIANDPRVYHIGIPPEDRTDIEIGFHSTQNGNFNKIPANTFSYGNFVNWGLKRASSPINNYGSNLEITGGVDFNLDGTGVDVVIQDSGIEVSHPEFQDANGVSRVQQIDWYTASGISGTQNVNHYRDFDGHGTHVAGIAAGKTYGWAKNAKIYSVKVNGLEGSGDSGTGITITDAFRVIKNWHLRKPVDSKTGVKRPTIVNMSWGVNTPFSSTANSSHPITYVNYRGSAYGGLPASYFTTNAIDYVYRFAYLGAYPYITSDNYYHTPTRDGTYDTQIQEMIDAGIHITIAAGNYYHKNDIPGGVDYDNYYTLHSSLGGANLYYHRGSSPFDDEAISVGALDSSSYSSSQDQKAEFSNHGPAVTIYAPGVDIMSACSNTNIHGANVYYNNTTYKQVAIGGTSQAAPQVCGVCALYLQANPAVTPAQLKKWLTNIAYSNTMYTTSGAEAGASTSWVPDWFNYRSTFGANSKVIYNVNNTPTAGGMSGGLTLTNGVITLT
jgi:subtilisin family serine protease